MDGRIHPARIEEMVEKAQKEVEVLIKEEGEALPIEIKAFALDEKERIAVTRKTVL